MVGVEDSARGAQVFKEKEVLCGVLVDTDTLFNLGTPARSYAAEQNVAYLRAGEFGEIALYQGSGTGYRGRSQELAATGAVAVARIGRIDVDAGSEEVEALYTVIGVSSRDCPPCPRQRR